MGLRRSRIINRIGIIGCGKIGGPVIEAVQSGVAGNWTITAILSRKPHRFGGVTSLTSSDDFFAESFELIIDTGSVQSFASYGILALGRCDVWTVNASALADTIFFNELREVGKRSGHRLRILSGAIAGLDGVTTASLDDDAVVSATIDLAPTEEPRTIQFDGRAKQAAEQFPDSVNVAIAAAIAGPGVEKTHVEIIRPNNRDGRKLRLRAEGRYGRFESVSEPRVVPNKIHTVAASIVAALRRENEVIWVG